MIKKILRWLFEERMNEIDRQSFAIYMDSYTAVRKNHVAERFLNELGYEIKFDSGVREQPHDVTRREDMGYRLVKKENK